MKDLYWDVCDERTPVTTYGQYCPVAKAAEILDQRWTLLVIRELVAGSDRFNDLHRGVPRMSRTLLSKRLRQLEHAGLVVRRETGSGPVYELTDAGEDLVPVIEAIGEWGIRWVDSLAEDDLDPGLLLWDMHRSVDPEAIPSGRTVVELRFADVDPQIREWWLVLEPGEVDVCDDDPGFGTDLVIDTPVRTLTRVWRGDLGWNDALRDGSVQVHGSPRLRRQLPEWFRLSYFAAVDRPSDPDDLSSRPVRRR